MMRKGAFVLPLWVSTAFIGWMGAPFLHSPALASPGFALQLEAQASGLNESESAVLRRFLAETEAHVPPRIRQALPRAVKVRFVGGLDSLRELKKPVCRSEGDQDGKTEPASGGKDRQILGLVRRGEIRLNQLFIAEILKGEAGAQSFECGHRNFYRYAKAVVLHELGHLYDRANPRSKEELALMKECRKLPHNGLMIDNRCKELYGPRRRTVSGDDVYLSLAGFTENGLLFQRRKQDNQSRSRTPDPYEYVNAAESFAVNLEFFLLDPEYACRRPAMHQYLARHLGYRPFPEGSCKPNLLVRLNNTSIETPSITSAVLDPSRIYQVHYVLAHKGQAMMSRWGHTLYRLVICDPKRKEPGPKCLDDTAFHVIASFRANVMDLVTSYWKGLTGKYPSELFLYPLFEIINEYNKMEFRDLSSYPIRMDEEEKRSFVYRLIEQHSEYSGRYKFVTQNCAVEAINTLKGILPDEELQDRTPISPKGGLNALIAAGRVDPSYLKDRARAVQEGYLYESKKPDYDAAFLALKRDLPEIAHDEVESYLKYSSASERMEYFKTLSEKRGGAPHAPTAGRFLLLESQIMRLRSKKKNEDLTRLVLDGDSNPAIARKLDQIRDAMDLFKPWNRKVAGYGVVLENDASKDPELVKSEEDFFAEQQKAAREILAWFEESFPEQVDEFEGTKKNRLIFLKEMNRRQ